MIVCQLEELQEHYMVYRQMLQGELLTDWFANKITLHFACAALILSCK